MGKRQIAQLQPYELVLTLLIADLASIPMAEEGVPLVRGILPIMALLTVNTIMSILSMKSERLRMWVGGKPSVVVRNGQVDIQELHKLAYSLTDLSEQVRNTGVASIADVGIAVLETDGSLSVFPNSENRPLTPRDMNLPVQYEGIPLTLVLDGRVQKANLKILEKDEKWLDGRLRKANMKDGAKHLVYALLETDGTLVAQSKSTPYTMYYLPKAYAGEVVW